MLRLERGYIIHRYYWKKEVRIKEYQERRCKNEFSLKRKE